MPAPKEQSESKAERPQNRHLRPIKPGERLNPKGRPKGQSLTTFIRKLMAEPDPTHGTKGEALIFIANQRARKGDFRFWKELIDRHDGKVPDRVADLDGTLKIEVTYAAPPLVSASSNGNGRVLHHADDTN